MDANRKLGDFSGLAQDYAKYRPDYSSAVLNGLLGLVSKPRSSIEAADVGAGTGIWTSMLASAGLKHLYAVEPNDENRPSGLPA